MISLTVNKWGSWPTKLILWTTNGSYQQFKKHCLNVYVASLLGGVGEDWRHFTGKTLRERWLNISQHNTAPTYPTISSWLLHTLSWRSVAFCLLHGILQATSCLRAFAAAFSLPEMLHFFLLMTSHSQHAWDPSDLVQLGKYDSHREMPGDQLQSLCLTILPTAAGENKVTTQAFVI